MLTARMMKRVLHGRYCLVMDQFIRKVIHLSSPGSPLEKTLAQHHPPTLLLQGFSHLSCHEDLGVISAVSAETDCKLFYLSQKNPPSSWAVLIFQSVKIRRNKPYC